MSVIISVAKEEHHLNQILTLQNKNLSENLSQDEIEKEGFVSVVHNKELLHEMSNPFPHVIALKENKVIAYALMMPRAFSKRIPML